MNHSLLRRIAAALLAGLLLAGASACSDPTPDIASLSSIRKDLDASLPVKYTYLGPGTNGSDLTYQFRSEDGVPFSVHGHWKTYGGLFPSKSYVLDCDYLNQWVAWRYPDEIAAALDGVLYVGQPPSVTLGPVTELPRPWDNLVPTAVRVVTLANLVLPEKMPTTNTHINYLYPEVNVTAEKQNYTGTATFSAGSTTLRAVGDPEYEPYEIWKDLRLHYFNSRLSGHNLFLPHDWPTTYSPVPVVFEGQPLLTIDESGYIINWGIVQPDVDPAAISFAETVRILGGTITTDGCDSTWTIGEHTWQSKAPSLKLEEHTICGTPNYTIDGQDLRLAFDESPVVADAAKLLGITFSYDEASKTAIATLNQ